MSDYFKESFNAFALLNCTIDEMCKEDNKLDDFYKPRNNIMICKVEIFQRFYLTQYVKR